MGSPQGPGPPDPACLTWNQIGVLVQCFSAHYWSWHFQLWSAMVPTFFPAFFGNFRFRCSRSHSVSSSFQPVLNFGIFFVFCMLMKSTDAVCLHCKDTIVGCKGGDQCPTVVDLAANVAVFATGTLGKIPNVQNLLPNFLRAVFTRAGACGLVSLAADCSTLWMVGDYGHWWWSWIEIWVRKNA